MRSVFRLSRSVIHVLSRKGCNGTPLTNFCEKLGPKAAVVPRIGLRHFHFNHVRHHQPFFTAFQNVIVREFHVSTPRSAQSEDPKPAPSSSLNPFELMSLIQSNPNLQQTIIQTITQHPNLMISLQNLTQLMTKKGYVNTENGQQGMSMTSMSKMMFDSEIRGALKHLNEEITKSRVLEEGPLSEELNKILKKK